MSKFIIFDTETTGLPKYYNAGPEKSWNWPRITQLAFALVDIDGNILYERQNLIKPDGWTIPKEEFFIKNNMSTERCLAEGVELEEIIDDFMNNVDKAIYKVAHNVDFDRNIVAAELYRLGINWKPFGYMPEICTMKKSTKFCAIPHKNGKGTKWPKLEELHQKLFGEGFEGAHDALYDIRATSKCLIELINRNIIKL